MADTGWLRPSNSYGWENTEAVLNGSEEEATQPKTTSVLRVGGFDFSTVKPHDIIDGVEVKITKRGTNLFTMDGTVDNHLILTSVKSGASIDHSLSATLWDEEHTEVIYGSPTDLWEFNNLKPYMLRDDSFNVEIRADIHEEQYEALIKEVFIKVHYHDVFGRY